MTGLAFSAFVLVAYSGLLALARHDLHTRIQEEKKHRALIMRQQADKDA